MAQSSKDARMERAKAQSEKLAKDLNLTQAQIEEKAEIDAAMYADMEAIQAERKAIMETRQSLDENSSNEKRESLSAEMDSLRKRQMEIKQKAEEGFMNILNEEQKAAYMKMKTPTSVKKTMESK